MEKQPQGEQGMEFTGDGEGMGQLSRVKAGGRGLKTREQGKVSGGISGQTGMRRRLSGQQGISRGEGSWQPSQQDRPGPLGPWAVRAQTSSWGPTLWSGLHGGSSPPSLCHFLLQPSIPRPSIPGGFLTDVLPAQLHFKVCSLESAWTLTMSRRERSKVLLSSPDANVSACSLGFTLLTFGIPFPPLPIPLSCSFLDQALRLSG